MITFCITSCNRWKLLEQTLDSFLKLNTFPIEKFILNEDSGDTGIIKKILDKYGDKFHIIRSPKNQGLLKSADNLMSLVDTPYVFWAEDDWLFQGNPNFIQESLQILSTRQDIHQVWIRSGIPKDWLETEDLGGFKMVKDCHFGDWNGFSFNPGLRRLRDYKIMFPQGYNAFSKEGINSANQEHACNQHVSQFRYRAAILNNPSCQHIGEGKSTYK